MLNTRRFRGIATRVSSRFLLRTADAISIDDLLPASADRMTPLISLQNIVKNYRSKQALAGVSLDVQPGITGLLGPNGAGKSTLIKMLLRISSVLGRHRNRAGTPAGPRGTANPCEGRLHARRRLLHGRHGGRRGRAVLSLPYLVCRMLKRCAVRTKF